jgi:hypothetical protein
MSASHRRSGRSAPRERPTALPWLAAGLLVAGLAAAATLAPQAAPADEPAGPPAIRPERAEPAALLQAAPAAIEAAPAEAPAPSSVACGPDGDDAPQSGRAPPRPGTERAFYASDLVLATRAGALAEHARQLFEHGGHDDERVAVLRALWDSATPGAERWFAAALRPAADEVPPPGRLSVGEFALGFLQPRAAREPAALQLLAQLVSDPAAPLALRRGAAQTVAANGDGPRLLALAADVAVIADPELSAAVARAASGNEHASEAAGLFAPAEECDSGSVGATDGRP